MAAERAKAESFLRRELRPLWELANDHGVTTQALQHGLNVALRVLEDPRARPAEDLAGRTKGKIHELLAEVNSAHLNDDRIKLGFYLISNRIPRPAEATAPNQPAPPPPAPTEMPDADEPTLSDLENWYKSCRTLSSKVGDDYYAQFENGFGETKEERDPKLKTVLAEIRKFTEIDGHLNEVSSKFEERKDQAEREGTAGSIVMQPVTVFGRCREGKSPAISSMVLAALSQHCAVIVGVAPCKKKPVADMFNKLKKQGFDGIGTTLAKLGDQTKIGKTIRIFIFSITSPADMRKAHVFVTNRAKDSQRTVVIIDECDELVMGQGKTSLSTRDETCHSEDCSEEEDEDDEDKGLTDHQKVAKSEALFRHFIQPTCLCFLVTATHLAAYAKGMSREVKKQKIEGISFYLMNKKAVFIRVRKAESYAGVEDMHAMFADETDKLDGTGLLKHPMIEHFAKRKNKFDRRQLELRSGDTETDPLEIEGSLFVSISRNVNVNKDHAHGLCRLLCQPDSPLRRDGNRPLVICYVGKPKAYTAEQDSLQVFDLPPQATLEEMEKECREKGVNYTHLVFVGWTMTRRSMTATFSQSGKLITPLYSIVKFSSTGKLDAEAQRLLRIGHDFGLYKKPEGYRMEVACPEAKLEVLKKYLALESKIFEEQEKDPKTYKEFLGRLGEEIEKRDLLGHRVGKPGLRTDGIAGKSSKDKSDKKWAEIAEGDRPTGCTWDGKSTFWNIWQREDNELRIERDGTRERITVPLRDWKIAKEICENRAAFEEYRDNVKKSKRQRAIREPTVDTPQKRRK